MDLKATRTVDLNPLPYTLAFKIIHFCVEHNIDKDKCIRMIEACSENPCPNIDWTLEIPEKYLNWILLQHV